VGVVATLLVAFFVLVFFPVLLETKTILTHHSNPLIAQLLYCRVIKSNAWADH
jgi:hypothetical protein